MHKRMKKGETVFYDNLVVVYDMLCVSKPNVIHLGFISTFKNLMYQMSTCILLKVSKLKPGLNSSWILQFIYSKNRAKILRYFVTAAERVTNSPKHSTPSLPSLLHQPIAAGSEQSMTC